MMLIELSTCLLAEGNTDIEFLTPIIKRVLQELSFDCHDYIELDIRQPQRLQKAIGVSFVQQVKQAAHECHVDFEGTLLFVHSDADSPNAQTTIQTKIQPAKTALQQTDKNTHCHNIVAIIPVQETEAWMLADTDLFRQEIGTKLNDVALNIHRQPETIADPKETIITAIRTTNQNLTKRRRHELSIGDLYESIGSKIDLSKLRLLPSFQAFEGEVREAFRFLGLL